MESQHSWDIVAQLVEWSIPTPEVCNLHPVIGKLSYRTLVYCQLYRKKQKERKSGREWPIFFKKTLFERFLVNRKICIENKSASLFKRKLASALEFVYLLATSNEHSNDNYSTCWTSLIGFIYLRRRHQCLVLPICLCFIHCIEQRIRPMLTTAYLGMQEQVTSCKTCCT